MMHKARRRTEGKVEGLCGEVSDDVGSITSPQGEETLLSVCASKSVSDALVGSSQTTLFDLHILVQRCSAISKKVSYHFILILDQKLDSFNGGGAGF
jgi:hypothetical protein